METRAYVSQYLAVKLLAFVKQRGCFQYTMCNVTEGFKSQSIATVYKMYICCLFVC